MGDLDKLHKYYDQMIAENVALNPSGARNLLLSGVDYHLYLYDLQDDKENKDKIKEDCMKFVDWAMTVYKQHNITFVRYHQLSLQHKLDRMD